MRNMLRRENELRLTETTQNLYDTCAASDSAKYTEITDNVQKQVLREFGFSDGVEGLQMYRSALSMFPDDEEMKNLVYYYKYNRSKQGSLQVGDNIDLTRITLSSLDSSQSLPLSSFVQQPNVPLVLIAGSIS